MRWSSSARWQQIIAYLHKGLEMGIRLSLSFSCALVALLLSLSACSQSWLSLGDFFAAEEAPAVSRASGAPADEMVALQSGRGQHETASTSWARPQTSDKAGAVNLLKRYAVNFSSPEMAVVSLETSTPAEFVLHQSGTGEHALILKNTDLAFEAASSWSSSSLGAAGPLAFVRPLVSAGDVTLKLVSVSGVKLEVTRDGTRLNITARRNMARNQPMTASARSEVRARMSPAMLAPAVSPTPRVTENLLTVTSLVPGSGTDGEGSLVLSLSAPADYDLQRVEDGNYTLRVRKAQLGPDALTMVIVPAGGQAVHRIYSARPERDGSDIVVHVFNSRGSSLKVNVVGTRLVLKAEPDGA